MGLNALKQMPAGWIGFFSLETPTQTFPLPASLAGPRGLTPPEITGTRARLATTITHTDDGLTVGGTYTISGTLHTFTPEELEADLDTLEGLLPEVNRVWRLDRSLDVQGGVLLPVAPVPGMSYADIALVFRVTGTRWKRRDEA